MSSANVLEALSKKNKNLRVAATENADLTKTYMALLSNLIVLCNRKGRAVRDIRIGNVEIGDRRMDAGLGWSASVRAPIRFGTAAARGEANLDARREFFDYAQRKAERLAGTLDRNPHLIAFLGRLVTSVKNYAAYHAIPYNRIRVDGAIIDKNDTLFMRLVR
jgi:hypothetical protein